jgi:hypothetical protein
MRASIYNAVSEESVDILIDFMKAFAANNAWLLHFIRERLRVIWAKKNYRVLMN